MLSMKKIYVILAGIIVTIFAFSPSVLAEESISSHADNVGEEIYEQQLNDGLLPGEEVVDFYREIPTNNELLNDEVIPDLHNTQNSEITPFSTYRDPRWFVTYHTYTSLKYGPWLYAGASTLSGGTLSATHTSSVSNTYSGTLSASLSDVNSSVGFDITYGTEKSVTYTSPSYPELADKGHRLQYRHVYKGYTVKQEKKYHGDSTISYGISYLYPRKWVERQYRVVTFDK